jgi:Cu(I)/Ag(I) efflux system membrane fusion protein
MMRLLPAKPVLRTAITTSDKALELLVRTLCFIESDFQRQLRPQTVPMSSYCDSKLPVPFRILRHVMSEMNPISADDTGALTPATTPTPRSRWQRAKFLLRAIEVRLRFIALFVAIGLLMTYWRTLENYWDRFTRPSTRAFSATDNTEYYCPMHPSVVRPGLEANGSVPNCPICGMPLSKRTKGEPPLLQPGVVARVQLSPNRIQLAGIKTVPAAYLPLKKVVRAVGYVEHDESRRSEIVARASGYVEKLYVDKPFMEVQAGDPLAEIYSPELYSSVQELQLAQKHGSADLVASARKRLKLLGIDDTEIDEALRASQSAARLLIRSPQSGHVIEKNVVEGSAVERGATLFEIADISRVWIEADVFETDLAFLHEGQTLQATVEAFPGRVFDGEIALIYPELNTETRTNRVRINLDNPEQLLRPGMYATVTIESLASETEPFRTRLASHVKPAGATDKELITFQKSCPVTGAKLGSMGPPIKTQVGDETVFLCCAACEKPLHENTEHHMAKLAPPPTGAVLAIPEQAVIDTGSSKIVYVEREPGVFEGVEVELGPRMGGYYPVLAGVTPGDKIAAAGSFLLDAETRLNPNAASTYFGASGAATSGESGAPPTEPKHEH